MKDTVEIPAFVPFWEQLRVRARLSPETCAEVECRLMQGDKDYGDSSWNLPTPKLLSEICQEAYDIIGWSVLMYPRLTGDQQQELCEICKVTELSMNRIKRLEEELKGSV